MTWHAKPSGGYNINSDEAKDNIFEVYNYYKDTWTKEAICGLLGNMTAESGLNPWRWQSDTVSLSSSKKGYGLVQFTPAYGYINNYGKGVDGYAPNLSVIEVRGGELSDATAQLIVINDDKAKKYLDRHKYCSYLDISSTYPFSNYKEVDDLYLATVAWLFNYEFPAKESRTEEHAQYRYSLAQICYEILDGEEPPTPPTPPTPTPAFPRSKMPLYMYLRKF